MELLPNIYGTRRWALCRGDGDWIADDWRWIAEQGAADGADGEFWPPMPGEKMGRETRRTIARLHRPRIFMASR